jgi:hypothetical protein
MELNPNLIDEIKHGRVVLLFGSGALHGAIFPAGKELLLGNNLKDKICDRFLGGDYKDQNLQYVSDLAISQSSLIELQEFINGLLEGVEPADFHKLIPTFKWRALFSTNYDLLIEDSYGAASNRLQKCRPIISNYDGLDEASRTEEYVPLIKLHGCLSRRRDTELPLILTVDQYNDYMINRDRLFNFLYQVAVENTLVFVGHSLQDADIRKIISLIDNNVKYARPRYYLIKPGAKSLEIEFWNERKISILNGGLKEFIEAIDQAIPLRDRQLALAIPPRTHPIQSRFIQHIEPSSDLISFLANDVDYVEPSLFNQAGDVKAFYCGASQEWFPIGANLDVHRKVGRKIIAEIVQIAEGDRISSVDFYLIKGEAGSGKSVLLRRLCSDIAINGGHLVLYVRPLTNIRFESLETIHRLTGERVYLVWDNAAANVQAISRLLRTARASDIKLTVITCERYPEWNTRCREMLDPFVTNKYELPYLGPEEIENLVSLLERHGCLGPALTPLGHEERKKRFIDTFGRQLLVALHEVTMGVRFEDIIHDEYQSLQPEAAKFLYRTICVLNRLRIPVRAGLIARVAGITFDKFKLDFFQPLQKVVLTSGGNDHDIHYLARHPEIAEIVFRRSFDSVLDRYHEYVRLIEALNISFESDRQSFRQMIKAKNLIELFPDYQDIQNIYEKAISAVGRDSYLLQQMANFERLRDNGNLREAVALLNEARSAAPHDQSILHSLAVLWKKRAELEVDRNAREQYRREARSILNELAARFERTPYIDAVLVEIAIDDTHDIMSDENSSDRLIDNAIRETEKVIIESKKRFPSDDFLLALEARFATMMRDEPRALRALKTGVRAGQSRSLHRNSTREIIRRSRRANSRGKKSSGRSAAASSRETAIRSET